MNYMTTHLLEAIWLNWKRLPLYAKHSGGKSIPVSLMLISSEILSLGTSILMDFRARYWQKRGVPVFVHEFVPMSEAPDFRPSFPFKIAALDSLPALDFESPKISSAIKEGRYTELSGHLESLIEKIRPWPHAFCMTRHTLESFLRSSNLAHVHIEKAQALGVNSPEKFCKDNLRSHHMALPFCKLLDRVALPLQNKGLPIIGRDVPPIAPYPEDHPEDLS